MARSTARLAGCAFATSIALASVIACGTSNPSPGPPSPTVARGSIRPATPAPASPSGPALATTSPARPTPASPTGWEYLVQFPAIDASEVTAVTGTPDGFVAVGFEPAEGEDFFGLRQGVIWRSADGRSWTREVDAALANATLLEVVSLGETIYVIGLLSICRQLEENCRDLPEAGITVWRSDPVGWQRMPQSRTMRDALIDGAIAAHGQVVAFGSSGDDLSATVWLSDDGAEWEDVTQLAGMDPLSALAAGPEGFVAFGTRYRPASDTIETVAAFSADGRNFERASLPDGLDAVIQSATYGPAGFVAVGYDDEPAGIGLSAAALASTDGRSWTSADPHASLSGTGFHHVSALVDGYVAVGFTPSGAEGEREEAASWVSADGVTWRPLAPLAGAAYRQFDGASSGPPGVAVFALDYGDEVGEEESSSVRAWFAPLTRLPPP
jgi:hypothetical protein